MELRWYRLPGVLLLVVLLLGAVPLSAAPFVMADYRLPAAIDPDIAEGATTEIWATLWRPSSLGNAPHPVIVLLHGNHGTCGRFDVALKVRVDDRLDYTDTGKCPSGYVVSPSHRGYAYLAEALSTAGFVVVSINANRGVNGAAGDADDFGLNLRRGRLVLKHLQLLSRWNRQGGAPASLGFEVRGKLDLAHVGLMGHSRGGEGMRAALALYADPGSPWPARIGPVGFKALYEIGPVDGQTPRTLNALGVAWNVLLPYCDGDVTTLEGIRPFERMLLSPTEKQRLPKATFAVYGANHNFYNSEWQSSDAFGCSGRDNRPLFPQLGGSADQRQTALASLVPFMRAYVARTPRPALAALLDPATPLPAAVAALTRVDRGFTDTPDRRIEVRIQDFASPAGSGVPELSEGIGLERVNPYNADPLQRAAAITWSGAGRHFYQTGWGAARVGHSLAGLSTLEFRVARQCNASCNGPESHDLGASTNFSIQLVRVDGSLSAAVPLAAYAVLRGPVGGGDGFLHPIPLTARIPLRAFGLDPAASISGVRFTFDRTAAGAIYLANVRASRRPAALAGAAIAARGSEAENPVTPAAIQPAAGQARIVAIRAAAATPNAIQAAAVEIEIAADRPLPVTDSLPTLDVGGQAFRQSRFAGRGRTDRLVFTVPAQQFGRLADGSPAELRIGGWPAWSLGALTKPRPH